jgi:hypothetical protein
MELKSKMADELSQWQGNDCHWFNAIREIKFICEEHGWLALPHFDNDKEWEEIFLTFERSEKESFLKAMFGSSFTKLKQAIKGNAIDDICIQAMNILCHYNARKKEWSERKLNTIIRDKQTNSQTGEPKMAKKTIKKAASKKKTTKKATTKKKVTKKKSSVKGKTSTQNLTDDTKIKMNPNSPNKIQDKSNRGQVKAVLGNKAMTVKAIRAACKKKKMTDKDINLAIRGMVYHGMAMVAK